MSLTYVNRILPLLCWLILCSSAQALEPLKALIIDGQNNHNRWPKTTMMMKKYLEESGRFEVDIARTKYIWNGQLSAEYPLEGVQSEQVKQPQTDPDFSPEFAKYDVVISNFGWKAASWPEATRKSFESYVANGGGFVVIHAANNSFPEWPEYNDMIGLGGWGGRNEKSGPYVYYDKDLNQVRDTSPGNGGGHGPQHQFQIVVRNTEHPITKGLPNSWLHTADELYERLRGPANNMTILATAFAAPDYRGSGRHEPMLMTIDYGEGRVFHTPMGHADVAFECVGFITTFLRGTEWAATGEVTLTKIPADFPTEDEVSTRAFE